MLPPGYARACKSGGAAPARGPQGGAGSGDAERARRSYSCVWQVGCWGSDPSGAETRRPNLSSSLTQLGSHVYLPQRSRPSQGPSLRPHPSYRCAPSGPAPGPPDPDDPRNKNTLASGVLGPGPACRRCPRPHRRPGSPGAAPRPGRRSGALRMPATSSSRAGSGGPVTRGWRCVSTRPPAPAASHFGFRGLGQSSLSLDTPHSRTAGAARPAVPLGKG